VGIQFFSSREESCFSSCIAVNRRFDLNSHNITPFHCAIITAAGIGPELVIAVGDGPEEEAAAFSFMIPFVKVTEAMDLRSVHSLVCAQLQLEYPLPDKSADSSCSLKRRSSVQATCVEIAEDKIFAQTDPLDVPWSTCVCPTGGPLVRSCSGIYGTLSRQ
jgi:hypothetical protein